MVVFVNDGITLPVYHLTRWCQSERIKKVVGPSSPPLVLFTWIWMDTTRRGKRSRIRPSGTSRPRLRPSSRLAHDVPPGAVCTKPRHRAADALATPLQIKKAVGGRPLDTWPTRAGAGRGNRPAFRSFS
jgi:hypothetical protein